MGNETELGNDGSDEDGKRKRILLCGRERLELVELVQYVGMIMNGDGRIEKAIRSRIKNAARVIYRGVKVVGKAQSFL